MRLPALRDREIEPLRRLTRVHAVSTAADACITVSLAGSLFFSVSVDAARPRLALYLLLTLAPFAVVAPLIGPVADRFGRAQPAFLAFTCQARAVLALFIAIDLKTLLLYPESFGVLVLGKAYAVVKRSLVPSLVDADNELVAANARLSRVGSIAGATGGSVAAVLLTLAGATSVLRLACVVHLVAAALALRIPRASATQSGTLDESEQPATSAASVRTSQLAMTALRAAGGLATFVVAFALKRSGAPMLLFGVVALTGTAASLAGTLVSPLLRRYLVSEHVMLGVCSATAVIGGIAAAVQQGRAGMIVVATTVAIASSAARHVFDSVLQRDLTDAARPRVFARSEAVLQLAWVVGALVPTVLNVAAGPGYLLVAAVAGFGIAAVLPGSVRARERPQ